MPDTYTVLKEHSLRMVNQEKFLLSKAHAEIYITFRAIKQKNNESIKKDLRSSIQHISI